MYPSCTHQASVIYPSCRISYIHRAEYHVSIVYNAPIVHVSSIRDVSIAMLDGRHPLYIHRAQYIHRAEYSHPVPIVQNVPILQNVPIVQPSCEMYSSCRMHPSCIMQLSCIHRVECTHRAECTHRPECTHHAPIVQNAKKNACTAGIIALL